ncbi:MAG: hypothetical protein ACLGHN_15620 [Bacteriovoracia bacterium]
MVLLLYVLLAQNNSVLVIPEPEMDKLRGCWATLFEEEDFQGSNLTLFEGDDLSEIEYSTGPLWREKLKSLTTGPTAQLTLYSKENFKGQQYIIPPSSNFSPLPWIYVNSLKIRCLSSREQRERD